MLTPQENFINRKSIIEKDSGTQIAFAKKVGISRIGLYKAITCRTKNKKMQQRICDALKNQSMESFWPEFYGADVVNDNGIKNSHDSTIGDHIAGVN